MEVETLGPLTKLESGESVEHVECWFLFKGTTLGESEDDIAAGLEPLLRETKGIRA